MREYFSEDPTARGDEIAAEMRTYYDEHRTATFWEKLFGKRSTDPFVADSLMLGLMQVVREADSVYAAQQNHLKAKRSKRRA